MEDKDKEEREGPQGSREDTERGHEGERRED